MARMTSSDPFTNTERRASVEGPFQGEELALAHRNSGMLLEALRHDVTPAGMHYLLIHFDVPYVADGKWQLEVTGRVKNRLSLSLDGIKRLPGRSVRVTLECAGNGRALMSPRFPSMPWRHEAVGTADWTGTPLRHVLEQAGIAGDAVDVVFIGADHGFDRGVEQDYARSLQREAALSDDVLLVWEMNGQQLLPQHGYPLRLVVPGWYGMASVKWLKRIEVLDKPFDGFQQVRTYMYRASADDTPTPVSRLRVKSLLVPPGIPDWFTRRRLVEAGPTPLFGRAWSGNVPIVRVEVGVDGAWHEAELDPPMGKFAWRGWRFTWDATPGEHELSCRATNAEGETQPLQPRFDMGGFGNNAVQRVQVKVR
jgi:DMSO/TMAO reductase YedYZ molybdopterin-dependent catalytic subunit